MLNLPYHVVVGVGGVVVDVVVFMVMLFFVSWFLIINDLINLNRTCFDVLLSSLLNFSGCDIPRILYLYFLFLVPIDNMLIILFFSIHHSSLFEI